ncbi:MAG: SEC-C metal-binding domain-containing protein [Planctomycetota bacterium]|jgi:uncharacterized protein YecA (UPF0149 family)
MAKDKIGDRFGKRKDKAKLGEFAQRTRSADDIQDEEDLIANTKKVDPITADAAIQRNDPCPCGSGKKYKKCCGKQD